MLESNDTQQKPRDELVVIVGPTAVGKTALSLKLAKQFDGEIISADSRQLYCGMDIGTAKPTVQELASVPHHLIDFLAPDADFTLVQYQEAAYRAIDDIQARDKLPLLVGGTGLYVRAVVTGMKIPRVPPNEEFRARLYDEAERYGHERLHARLAEVDPGAAAKIDARNVRRVIRALEVYEMTGKPISEQQRAAPPPYHILQIGLTMEREKLYERINARVDEMLSRGLVEEVRALVERGYDYNLPSMSGLGYRQIGMYLRGEVDYAEAVRLLKRDTRRLVKSQYSWFRRGNPNIHWFDAMTDFYEEVADLILGLMQKEEFYRRDAENAELCSRS